MIKWTKLHNNIKINKLLVRRSVGVDPNRAGYSQRMLVRVRFKPRPEYKAGNFEPRLAVMNFNTGDIIVDGMTGTLEI